MTKKENMLRTIRFERPDYIPMTFAINNACFHQYDQDALQDLMESHPFLFPDFKRKKTPFTVKYALVQRKDQPYVDDWGCRWETTMDGITGTVLGHPLADWDNFADYKMPDSGQCMGIGPIDWNAEKMRLTKMRENGEFVVESLRHGHTFLQICDIRGYQNVLFDMEDEEPRLRQLIDMVTEFNTQIVKKYMEIGVDMFGFGEDLGMQVGPMLSPKNMDDYILPAYKKIMKPVQDSDAIIHMHSDGDIRTLVPYLLEGGVEVLNLQDLVNGIDWIKQTLKGKVCIDLDIDRQNITRFGTPAQIEDLVRREVTELGSKEGGLSMVFGLYPGTPLENVKALMDTMEKYAFYYN